jgi:hypothetical protein
LQSGPAGDEERAHEAEARAVEAEAGKAGLRPMPVPDQMRLQWSFISAGLEQVVHELS